MQNLYKNNKVQMFFLWLLTFIGLILSCLLVWVYYKANFTTDLTPSFCTLSETIDCDGVARTNYSVFLGIPLAGYGLLFYSTIIFLLLTPFFPNVPVIKEFKRPLSYIFFISTFSCISAVILSWISSFIINKICILCYFTYLVNIFIFLTSKIGESVDNHYKYTFEDIKSFLKNPLCRKIFITAVVIASLTVFFLNSSKILANNPAHDYIKENNNNIVEVSNVKLGNVLGSKNPKLVIDEYTDFQCPFCAISNFMMLRLVKEVKGVQVIHHDFPLNGDCNPYVKTNMHPFACKAALYAKAARKQGKYWDFIAEAFKNQHNLNDKTLLKIADSIGLDTYQLKKDAKDPDFKKEIEYDVNKAVKQGINGTPTLVIGMKKHEGIQSYPELKKLVLDYLKNEQ